MRLPWTNSSQKEINRLEEILENQERLIVALQNRDNHLQTQVNDLSNVLETNMRILETMKAHLHFIEYNHGYEIDMPVIEE